ncbi:MAG: TonB-dependent receptor [Armatimonadota bacterium]|nr:TonB-dependent receptor [Armatimonadota bacterium]
MEFGGLSRKGCAREYRSVDAAQRTASHSAVSRLGRFARSWLAACLLIITLAGGILAADDASEKLNLAKASLEDLAGIEVTSVSRRAEELIATSAAAYVITQEDIRRSGMTSVPELLRMVPGLDVARVNSSMWAISSRGLNERFAKMMLVLIDGRSVYTPLFSGVFWDVQDLPLSTVERIEVIRGPGATMWGANAVNGIINIITKNAKDTTGSFATAAYGTDERPLGDVRHGGKIGSGFYRVYARGFQQDNFVDSSGDDTHDAWRQRRGGFRMDWNGRDSYTLQGDLYDGREQEAFAFPTLLPPFTELRTGTSVVSGGNLLGRWSRSISDDSEMTFQAYYDRTNRDSLQFGEKRTTYDLDFNHRFASGSRHSIIWGLGYRNTRDSTSSSDMIMLDPARSTRRTAGAFVQDDVTITKNRLRLTLGSKFEDNTHSGFELQPNLRLLYTPDDRHTLWTAISRAVRTPTHGEHDARVNLMAFSLPDDTPVLLFVRGGHKFDSEELTAYELGYRSDLGTRGSVDIAAFYNSYNKLRMLEAGAPVLEFSPFPHLEIPLDIVNGGHHHTHGAEIAFNWNFTPAWRMSGSYTWLSRGLAAAAAAGADPKNQFSIRSQLDLPRGMEMDVSAYYVGRLDLPTDAVTGVQSGIQTVPSYLRLDLRLGWRANDSVAISIGARNILDKQHLEFAGFTGEQATEIPRSFYGQVALKF